MVVTPGEGAALHVAQGQAGPVTVTGIVAVAAVGYAIVSVAPGQLTALHLAQGGAGAVAQAAAVGMAAIQRLAVIVPAGGGTFRHRAGLGSAAGGPSVAAAMGEGSGNQQGHGTNSRGSGNQEPSQRHDGSTSKKFCSIVSDMAITDISIAPPGRECKTFPKILRLIPRRLRGRTRLRR